MQEAQVKKIYLDAASTMPMRKEIADDAYRIMREYYGNADALHREGQRVSRLVESSHKALADMLGVLSHEVYYTSGGSESNSWAIVGIALAQAYDTGGKHIVSSEIEHASVLNACQYLEKYHGFEVDYLPVNRNGQVDPDVLAKSLRHDTVLVSLFAVNNELGSINDLEKLAEVVKKHSSASFHVDGVQALGKHAIPHYGVDAISYSAHKIGGLKGSGLLIKKASTPIHPIIFGGQQQNHLRGGTLDNPAVILWAKTLRLALEEEKESHHEIVAMHQYLHAFFKDKKGFVIHSPEDGSPYIFNFSCLKVPSEIMMNALNEADIYVSAQSTCHSQEVSSHVLKAIGCSEREMETNIRLSLSTLVNMQDIEYVCEKIMEIESYVQS